MSTNYPRPGNYPGRSNVKVLPNSPRARRPVSECEVAPPEPPITKQPTVVDRLVTTRQAAAILGILPDTLKKWRQRPGNGPEFIRYPGGAIRYRLSTIMKFLEDCTVRP
jgi:hypothetical protein